MTLERDQFIAAVKTCMDLIEAGAHPHKVLKPLVILRRALNKLEDQMLELQGADQRLICLHCHQVTHDYYMVTQDVWHRAVPDAAERYAARCAKGVSMPLRGDYLHLKCLEARIGRRITVEDLTPAPCNDSFRYFLLHPREETLSHSPSS